MQSPKEIHNQPVFGLAEQFRRKGYKCEAVRVQDATIFVLTHEKKMLNKEPVVAETCKKVSAGKLTIRYT